MVFSQPRRGLVCPEGGLDKEDSAYSLVYEVLVIDFNVARNGIGWVSPAEGACSDAKAKA